VIDLDPEVADSAFDLRVPKQNGRITAWRNVIDFQGDYVATTKFAVDSDLE
jgi:hypothetical protein